MTKKKKDDADHLPGARRRGKILENAILQAALDELNEVGYAHLTMEGVAARAKTNKTAVYRRWPQKSELVVAALHKYTPKITDDAPDTGDLRNDILILLRRITVPLQTIGAETIHGLMLEHLGKVSISAFTQIRRSEGEEKWHTIMMTILKNAEMRGEVSLKKISPRIISLPIDLLRFEFLATFEPVSDETLTEIIDDIFLPLVHL
ncbi:TetR/AcrR family transcriptional regulator [Candidatus Formimonas warabiya]|uniref:TetR family transcriptional regulator n=1 Tax=Formimonas warabiya TaxID=1761012 RepID=A0A3G1KUC3_FORW1|nr:TetR/AcrR family transcriptional regulator [Candidatus Formimonas warabiya]ATW25775.1 TetR family transcriptional regulator [Candidatus Formimonas warabiya]